MTKLFSVWGVPGDKDLDKVIGWRQGDADPDIITSKPVHCGTCGHAGSVASHRKLGCSQCSTSTNCRYVFTKVFSFRFDLGSFPL